MTINYIEKGNGLFEFIIAAGYQLYQLDGVWVAEPPGSDDIVNALILAYQPPVAPRKMVRVDWKMRIPAQKYAALKELIDTDQLVWTFFDILNDTTLDEVNLDSPYLSGALDYLIATYPELITAADKAAWLA